MPSSSNPIPEVALEPQWYPSSCWAASLAMAARMLAPGRKELNQCYFIHQKENEPDKCGCIESIFDFSTETVIEKIVYLNNQYHCGVYEINVGRALPEKIEELAQQISKDAHIQRDPVPIEVLRQKTGEKKLLLFYYTFADFYNNQHDEEHVCLVANVENLDHPNGSASHLLALKDPWPTCIGTEYFMSYDSYRLQPRAIGICLWNRTEPDLSGSHLHAADVDEAEQHMDDIPEKVAENTLITLQYMLDNHKNTRLLEKIGLNTADNKIRLSGISYEVNDVGSSIVTIYENLQQIGIMTLNNTRDFQKRIYFLIQDNEVKTAFILCKSVKYPAYQGKWFLHSIETGKRYRGVIPVSVTDSENLVLFRITGKIDGELLAKRAETGAGIAEKENRVNYRIISRIRFNEAKK